MTCERVCELLSPYADGELDLLTALEVERHAADCPVAPSILSRCARCSTAGKRIEICRLSGSAV